MKELAKITKASGGVSTCFKPIEQGAVLVPKEPLDLRCHCEKSSIKFSIGGQTDEGKLLKMHIINARDIDRIRPSEAYETPANFTQFIGLVDVGGKKVLSCLTFGSSSADAARQQIAMIEVKSSMPELGQFIGLEFMVTIEIEKTKNKKGQEFGVARFSMSKATQNEIEQAIEALTIDPDCYHKFRDLPNIDA